MKIIPIQTGIARIKPSQARAVGRGEERIANIFGDPGWTPDLPILAWAILHPDGVILVDTGETSRAMAPGWYPAEHPYYQYALRVEVSPEQEIGAQLRRHGIAPGDVRTVLLTHLHTDHAGGLHDVEGAEVWVHSTEHAQAQGDAGIARGYLPHRFPAWFAPNLYEFTSDVTGCFGRAHRVTRSGDVCVVETPGHTGGHTSVIVTDGDLRYFIAGDATYAEETLLEKAVDGISPDEEQALATLEAINVFLGEAPTVYLPSHDVKSVERARTKQVTRPRS